MNDWVEGEGLLNFESRSGGEGSVLLGGWGDVYFLVWGLLWLSL